MVALLMVMGSLVLLVVGVFALAAVIDGAFGGGIRIEVCEEPPRKPLGPPPQGGTGSHKPKGV